MLNKLQSTPIGPKGMQVYFGTSYIQTVTFDDHGPVADAILTYGAWQRRFGGKDVIGQALTLSGNPGGYQVLYLALSTGPTATWRWVDGAGFLTQGGRVEVARERS